MSKDFVVAKLEPAMALLRQAVDVPSAKRAVDAYHAAEVYARRQKLNEEGIAMCHRGKVDAMTLLGDFWREQPKQHGSRGVGKSGVPKENSTPPTLSEMKVDRKEAAMAAKLSVMKETEPEKHEALRNGEGRLSAVLTPAHVSQNGGDNEWYTPKELIEAAREVMGGIDLDPASSEEANDVVKARKFYSAKENGLTREWLGKVWMNPPYEGQLIKAFCDRLFQAYTKERVSQAIVLVNNATETGWFQQLAEMSVAASFPRGRVKFWHPRKEAVPLQGQAILYAGEKVEKFVKAFRVFGFVCRLVK